MDIKILCTNNGREYMCNKFQEYLQENCIINQHIVSYNPQQTENLKGKISPSSTVQDQYSKWRIFHKSWEEAVPMACYLQYRLPITTFDNLTPFQAWIGNKPHVSINEGHNLSTSRKTNERNSTTRQSRPYSWDTWIDST